jgi:hypothetical protein
MQSGLFSFLSQVRFVLCALCFALRAMYVLSCYVLCAMCFPLLWDSVGSLAIYSKSLEAYSRVASYCTVLHCKASRSLV